MAPLTNKSANQLLKRLYKTYKPNAIRQDVVDEGYAIYVRVREPRNHFVVNTFLKLCHDFKYPQKALSIRQDVHRLLSESTKITCTHSTATATATPNLISIPLLLNVLGQCSLSETEAIFHSLPRPLDISAVGAMMKVYTENDAPGRALKLYEMQQPRSWHNDLTHNLAIKACAKSFDLEKGREIHRNLGNIDNIQILNSLIHFYGTSGDLDTALSVFHSVDVLQRDIVTLNTVMLALIKNDDSASALRLYDECTLQRDDRCHMLAVKACINTLNFDGGKAIHCKLKEERGSSMDIELATTLIDCYGAAKDVWSATDIFNSIPQSQRSIVCNNAMLKALCHCGHHRDALTLYDSMRASKRNGATHLFAVESCIRSKQHRNGMGIIDRIPTDKLKDVSLSSKLIEFYGHFGDIHSAKRVYHLIDGVDRNMIHRTAMMNALFANALYEEALSLHKECGDQNDAASHALAIRACVEMDDLSAAVCIHRQIDSASMSNQHLVRALIECYSRFGDIVSASNVFADCYDSKGGEAVTAMMRAYIDSDCHRHALDFYDEHFGAESESDKLHVLAIKACAAVGDEERGRRIYHVLGSSMSNIAVRTSLVDMFGAFGDVEAALRVFGDLGDDQKNMVTVNAMMSVLYKNGRHSECMEMFRRYLECDRMEHDVIFYTVIIASCIESGNVLDGKEVHESLKRDESKQWILNHDEIATNLINFYGKEGAMEQCQAIFGDGARASGTEMKSVSVWNAMLHSYGMNGDIERAKSLFDGMVHDGDQRLRAPRANRKTFIHMINALSHCGDIDGAVKVWEEKIESEKIKYDDFVMSALIDCMARNGEVRKGFEYITRCNVQNEVAWIALMSGCKRSNDLEMAQRVFHEMIGRFGESAVCVEAACKMFHDFSNLMSRR